MEDVRDKTYTECHPYGELELKNITWTEFHEAFKDGKIKQEIHEMIQKLSSYERIGTPYEFAELKEKKQEEWKKAYIAFISNPENAHKCDICPANEEIYHDTEACRADSGTVGVSC